jgi:hypothetical protein
VIRLLFSLTALNVLLLLSVLSAARAQAPHEQMRDVLFTPDCAPPCFLGFHPGVTTRDEVLAILRAHPWVERVTTPAASD